MVVVNGFDEPAARGAKRKRPAEMDTELVLLLDVLAGNGFLGARELGCLSCVSRCLYEKCKEHYILWSVMHAEWPATARIVDPSLRTSCGPHWLFQQLSSRLAKQSSSSSLRPEPYEETNNNENPQTQMKITNLDETLVVVNLYENGMGRSIVSQAFLGASDLEECMNSSGELSFDLPRPLALNGAEVYIQENGKIAFVREKPSISFSASFDIISLKDRNTTGFTVKDFASEPPNHRENKSMFSRTWTQLPGNESLISKRLSSFSREQILDKTFDLTETEANGWHKVFCSNQPLPNDLLSRMSVLVPNFRSVDASFALHTRLPFRGPRVFGMNLAVRSFLFREEISMYDSEPTFGLPHQAAERHLETFWQKGRSDPDLAPFFQQADKEFALSDVDPRISVVSMSIRLSVLAAGSECGLGDPRCSGLRAGQISPRTIFESLL